MENLTKEQEDYVLEQAREKFYDNRMKKYSVTIRVDGRNYETKPFYAFNERDAINKSQLKARQDFPKAEEVDCINVEEITE